MPILLGLQVIVDSGLRKSDYHLYSEWNDIYNGTINADLIIMGSSRAWIGISPNILDEELNLNTYNLGINAWTFPMQNARFNIYLQHNKKPKYIVHNMDIQMLSRREDLFNYQQFLPYLNDPDIRAATKGYKGEFGLAQYYFPMFKYNGNLNLAAAGFLSYLDLVNYERVNTKGYEGRRLDWDGSFDEFKKKNPSGYTHPFEKEIAEEFRNYLMYCKENEIKVILVFSPEYAELHPLITNEKDLIALFQSYSTEFDIPFLDYSEHPICFNKAYFYNSEHLNKEGSELFSNILAQDLLNLGISLEQTK